MKNKQKNVFLITWVACIVLLLFMCFFGVRDSMKGTMAAQTCERYACQSGGTLSGDTCIVTQVEIVCTQGSSYSCSGSSTCCGSDQTISCTYVPSSGVHNCSCTKGGACHEEVVNSYTYDATCTKWSDNDDDDEENFKDANYYGTYADVMSKCKSMNNGVECECTDLGALSDGSHAFNCSSKTVNNPSSSSSSCTYASQGHCEGVTGRKCVYGNDKCWYAASASGTVPSKSCTEAFGSVANGYWSGMCETVTNSDGSYDFVCKKGNNCQLSCVSGYTLEDGACVKCEDCEPCENPKCYYNSSTGAYSWGTYADVSEWEETSLSQSQCKNEVPSGGSNPPSSSSSPKPSSSSSKPSSSSSKPSSSSSKPSDRGEGCYKNKDTGEYKWLEKNPEVNSQIKLYEKVDDSKCDSIPESSSSVPKPSSSENITVNPQTGEIAMFLIWILGFGAAGYSVWYYIKSRKEN